MLRAGGYFAWAAQPVYKHELVLEQQWEGILHAITIWCILRLFPCLSNIFPYNITHKVGIPPYLLSKCWQLQLSFAL